MRGNKLSQKFPEITHNYLERADVHWPKFLQPNFPDAPQWNEQCIVEEHNIHVGVLQCQHKTLQNQQI